ncbi:MAG: hypothetical protein AAF458_01855 [Pseudomonadota bacterium]
MFQRPGNRPLMTAHDVQSYFEDAVRDASKDQGVGASPDACNYVAGMLARFSRTDRLVEKTPDGRRIPALAQLYARAHASGDSEERCRVMQQLGDVALFLAGVFTESFNRKLVDVDYCIAMGRGAYGYIASAPPRGQGASARPRVYAELSERFVRFVDVLNQIWEHSAGRSNCDVLRLYEVWMRTRSPRAAQQLKALGVDVLDAGSVATRH